MLTDQEMLQYIDQNAEMRCHEISQILPHVTDPSLHHVLKDQQVHYQLHRSETSGICGIYHKATTKSFSNSMPNLADQRSFMNSSSHLAKQMMNINLSEMIHLQNHLNKYHAGDPRIRALAEKQLDIVSQCMKQIRPFL